MLNASVCAVLAICISAAVASGQDRPVVALGFGLDTTAADVRAIVGLVRTYLEKPDSTAVARGLWSARDPLFARSGDISGRQAYQGFAATIVAIVPDKPGDSVYVVKLLHASVGARSRQVSLLALQRLYAVRESGGSFPFRLTNALSRTTSTWQRRSSGPLTFHYGAAITPDGGAIARAGAFVDSIARLFRVPPPTQLDVYVTASLEDAQRAIGLDFFADASGPGEGRGGRTLPGGIVLAGDSTIREAYHHEFVHAVLGPTLPGRSYLWSEGVATWLGGSRGRPVKAMYALLQTYLAAHPAVSLRALVKQQYESGGKLETDLVYASAALIANAVHRQRGVQGLRELAALPDADGILDALPGLLSLSSGGDEAIDRWWRSEAARASR